MRTLRRTAKANPKARHTGRPWQRIRARVIAEETHCALCGKWVDKTLPPRHRWSATVDLVRPLSRGGSPLDRANLRLAHYRCNSSRGDGTKRQRRTLNTTRQW